VDGYEGMEGNGPMSGTPVGHRIALASTDFLAVDRVGLACMEIDASWPGYLNYAYQAGLGQYDLNKIDVVGAKIADVQKKYRLHADTDRMLEWRGPCRTCPPTWAATVVPRKSISPEKGTDAFMAQENDVSRRDVLKAAGAVTAVAGAPFIQKPWPPTNRCGTA